MSKKNSIQVLPDAVVFREIAVGDSDFVDVYITNTGSAPTRIRCSMSLNSPFVLSNEGTMMLPPGLETKVSITYNSVDLKIYTAELYIETKSDKITIPVKASPPSAHITADVSTLNLGQLVIEEENKCVFSITNAGMREGSYAISCDDSSVVLMPKIGSLLPNRSQEINCTFRPHSEGEFQIQVSIMSPESIDQCQPIVIKGTVAKSCVQLLFEEKPISEFDFQTIYYQQKRIIRAKLVNYGLLSRSFVIFPPQDHPLSAQSSISSYTQKADDIIDTSFSAIPSEGLLEPNKSETINFVFQPELDSTHVTEDIENLYNHFTFIEIVETGQRIDLQFTGKAVRHLVSLSSVDFDFGKCNPNTKTTKDLTITNNSSYLATTFEISPIAQFRFRPNKGEILPGKNKKIEIVYFPKNYGVFDTTTRVNFSNGLIKKPINLVAECGNPNEKPFKRIPIYEKDANAMFTVMHPDKKYTYGMDEIQQNTTKRLKFDSYITDQAKNRAKVQESTEFYERTVRDAKSQLTRTVGQFTDEDLNELVQQKMIEHEHFYENEHTLGLAPGEGLKAPDPPIRRKPSPLFILHPEKFGIVKESKRSQTAFHSRKKMHLDDTMVAKKKFKPKPTTPQEINDCARALTPAQQLQVNSSHQSMNFGCISVFQVATKSFTVSNNLQQYILIALQPDSDELSQTTPLSQVIPPRSVAGFDIKISSKKQMNFLGNIHYTINGKHSNNFTVSATVVPIDIQLSRNIIEFRFSSDSTTPVIKEFVTITNNSIGAAQYTWTGMNNFFSISTTQGTIDPGKVHNLEITYTPTTHAHDETTMVVNVVGGASRALRCIGDVGVPKMSVSKKTVAFGLIPIGITKTQIVRLKNNGDDDALFSIVHGNLSEMSISPENGRVSAHNGLNLQININSVHDHVIDIPVTVSIAGAQPISFNVTAQSEFPNVSLANTEFEFGRLFVGSSASLPAKLTNNGAIPAILYLDLSAHPEFHLEFPAELADNGEHTNSISFVSDTVFVTKSEMKISGDDSSALLSTRSEIQSSRSSRINKNAEEVPKGLIYKISVIEKSTITFNFVFQPTEVGEHSFELPFTMMNVLSPSSFHLQPIVSGEAIHAPLWVSAGSLDFEVAPIFDKMNPHSRPVVRQILIRNEHKTELKWRFDTSNPFCDEPSVFSVEPSFGTIDFAQSKNVHVSFTPRDAIPYSMQLPIYVTVDKDEYLIGQVQLTGVGNKSSYRMSVNHVALPIVPLNVKSQMNLFVLNEGFIETELKVKFAVDENHFPVKITFPEGQKLEHSSDKLPIIVSFQSPKPMSFSTVIALIDDLGGATTFEVTCTTDNSIFTLYPYFYDRELAVKSSSGKPIMYETKVPCIKANELTSRFLITNDINELKNEENWNPTCNDIMIVFVQRYLNALVMSSQISDFPNDFIRNDFTLWHEAIHNMSNGKRIPGENDRGDTSKDPLTKRIESAQRIIRFLESFGALLSSVKPEFLLSKQDFLQIMRARLSKQLLGINRFNSPDLSNFDQKVLTEFTSSKSYSDGLLQRLKILEELYPALSIESWMIVITQMIKIFSINKIDPERLSKTPGVPNVIKSIQNLSSSFSSVNDLLSEIIRPTKNLIASNVFSTSECVVLKWISLYYCNISEDLQKSINSFEYMNNGLPLAALVKSHSPSTKININEHASDHPSRENNAIEVTTALKELKLGFCPRANEIVDGPPCVLAMTSAYLFETLPHFLPQTTLEFTTTLHKSLQKTVSVTNPSKTEIRYTAVLEAGPNYSLANNNFVIGPNQTIEFPVTFNARTLKPAVGKLYLTPSRPRVVNSVSASAAATAETTAAATASATAHLTPTSSSPNTSRNTPQMPIFSAPIVVDLVSDVSLKTPDGSYIIEGPIYQSTKLEITVKNFIGVPSSVQLISRISQITNANGTKVNQPKTLQEQMIDFINNPFVGENNYKEEDSQITNIMKSHKMFIFSHKQIDFNTATSEVDIEVEFIPITLGEFRCLLLFEDEEKGEFILEIIAKSKFPDPIEVAHGKFKAEANRSCSYSIPLEQMNSNLMKALAYSIEKNAIAGQFVSERKMKDMLTRRQHECEALFRQAFQTQKFTVNNSAPNYFEMPTDVILYKSALAMSAPRDTPKDHINAVPITFKPIKAGDYPCKILLLSKYDVRLMSIKGSGLVATKELSIDFSTVVGKPMKQDIPLQNPSDDTWNFKITVSGDNAFSANNKIVVKPKSQAFLPVNFAPNRIGKFKAELNVLNINKEATVIYKLTANVEEPPAEDKIIVECQARQVIKKTIDIKTNLIKGNNIQVSTTIPIIKFKSDFAITTESGTQPFEYQIYAPRSGVAAGTLTFTDPQTKNYVWYVIEIHVDTPSPEQTIEVVTDARKCATVKIPIANPKSEPAQFTVVLSDDDLFGEKTFVAAPNSTTDYILVVSPLKAMKRASSVYFYSDGDGEFWYSIHIEANEPPANTLAPLTSPLGKYASTFIQLENPLDKAVSFRVDNDNPTAYHIVAKRVIQLNSQEKKRIEIRYIPTVLGVKEHATISFKSNEVGDWIYKLTGTGKPPQPLSPIIVTSPVMSTNSALVLFANPFPYPCRFSVTMSTEAEADIFKFLVKRKVFTLTTFGEEYQIPFTFSPTALGQFQANIIVASLGSSKGPLPSLQNPASTESHIQWVFPIIGNSLIESTNDIKLLKVRAHENLETELQFPLVGEKEIFEPTDYSLEMNIPSNFEFVNFIFDIKPKQISRTSNSTDIITSIRFTPKRPLNITLPLKVKNPLGQEWQFLIEMRVERGKPTATIQIESLLNKTGTTKVSIPAVFRDKTPFHAYFVQGSALEFTVTPDHGFIQPSYAITDNWTELPVTVVFAPKMYGKVLKGILVIDTLDSQFLFDVVGKTPEYVPPMIPEGSSHSRLDNIIKKEDIQRMQPKRDKRKIIKENIELAKKPHITSPHVSRK
ncbi:hypothetical protein TRFO_35785 [Tritrichomonas foetus]|uniref:MSP domain-containing protein n=1 Tax=Tritrichomonas foetus TaxID=1144522 RepID=A0A1J4JFC0_9EUKA|nr:hypothetical protein TRFO_35785 [Tritrichomonas foetus]|eukprot:OHS97910.1 hypothetical protein TRFO_35785 [Tritrichomonas foetus]